MSDEEVRELVVALEALLSNLDESAAAPIQALVTLYGEGLRRITAALEPAPQIADALARDELVGHLLDLHDLLPSSAKPVSPAIAFGPVLVP